MTFEEQTRRAFRHADRAPSGRGRSGGPAPDRRNRRGGAAAEPHPRAPTASPPADSSSAVAPDRRGAVDRRRAIADRHPRRARDRRTRGGDQRRRLAEPRRTAASVARSGIRRRRAGDADRIARRADRASPARTWPFSTPTFATDANRRERRTTNGEPRVVDAIRRALARGADRVQDRARADAARRARRRRRNRPPPDDASAEEDTSARRYARLLVSEIKLYHESAVIDGRRDRDLATRLGGEIARARAMYEQRVPPHVRERADYFHDELVRTLANGDASLLEVRTLER